MINEQVNPIELLDYMLDSGDDIWETAVSIGIQNEQELTKQRWLQGDLTLRVEGTYGDKIITKFATALNVNTSTLKQRRTMSRYYTLDTRYLFESLGYSHYREAMRIGNLDESIEALELASKNEWPVWELAEYVNEHIGKEKSTHESYEGKITGFRYSGGVMHLQIDTQELTGDLAIGQTVTIKIKD